MYFNRSIGLFANDIKDLFQIFTKSVLLTPAGQVFSHGIDKLNVPIFVRSNHGVTDTSQNRRKPLFAFLKFPLHLMPVERNLDVKV